MSSACSSPNTAGSCSGDPDFFLNEGRRSIPNAIIQLSRPIGIRQTYAILPRFAAKYVKTELRVVRTDERSAIVRWFAGSQLALVPPELHHRYVDYACQAYRGTFASIPLVGFGQPAANVRQSACQLHGDEYCEWEFTWEPVAGGSSGRDVVIAVALSFALLLYFLLQGPAWVGPRDRCGHAPAGRAPAVRRLGEAAGRQLRRQQTLLLEQREVSERGTRGPQRGVQPRVQVVAELALRVHAHPPVTESDSCVTPDA